MKKIFFTAIIGLLALSCGTTKTYQIIAKGNTQTSGTVSFTQNGNRVKMMVNAQHLTPGVHAIHLHEKADCSAPDATSTGGHWNPTQHEHGKWGIGDYHMGDIGNLTADAQGNAKLTFSTDSWCVGCSDPNKNIIGRGLIIHAAADDFHTQPTGNAGGRVGCVEIK